MTLGTAGVSGDGRTRSTARPTSRSRRTATSSSPTATSTHASSSSRRTASSSRRGARRATAPASSTCRTRSSSTRAAGCWSATASNKRIQMFDQEGKFLEQWTQFGSPSGIFIAPDDTLYVVDYNDKKRLFVGSAKDGSIRYAIHDLALAEGVAVDAEAASTSARRCRPSRRHDHRARREETCQKMMQDGNKRIELKTRYFRQFRLARVISGHFLRSQLLAMDL